MSKQGSYCCTRHLLQISVLLIEFVYGAVFHCLTSDREESQVPRQSFPKVNRGPDTHAQAQKHTHDNEAPRGLGHPADSILFLLKGPCVTKDNLASFGSTTCVGSECLPHWLVAWGFVYLPSPLSPSFTHPFLFLLISSGLQWGVLGTWLSALLTTCPPTLTTLRDLSHPFGPMSDTQTAQSLTCTILHQHNWTWLTYRQSDMQIYAEMRTQTHDYDGSGGLQAGCKRNGKRHVRKAICQFSYAKTVKNIKERNLKFMRTLSYWQNALNHLRQTLQ